MCASRTPNIPHTIRTNHHHHAVAYSVAAAAAALRCRPKRNCKCRILFVLELFLDPCQLTLWRDSCRHSETKKIFSHRHKTKSKSLSYQHINPMKGKTTNWEFGKWLVCVWFWNPFSSQCEHGNRNVDNSNGSGDESFYWWNPIFVRANVEANAISVGSFVERVSRRFQIGNRMKMHDSYAQQRPDVCSDTTTTTTTSCQWQN